MSNPFNFGSSSGGGPGGDLPPPFGQKKREEKQVKVPAKPFKIGGADFDPLSRKPGSEEEGGMIVGPDHPGFWSDDQFGSAEPGSIGFLPPGAVPQGARFDPISPVAPGSFGSTSSGNRGPVWPSGDPDPDAEPMSGPQIDPVHPGWRPPRGPPPGAGPFGGSSPPFFR